jgi:hypothetical protein
MVVLSISLYHAFSLKLYIKLHALRLHNKMALPSKNIAMLLSYPLLSCNMLLDP